MAAVKRFSRDAERFFPPYLKHVVGSVDEPLFPPKSKKRARYLSVHILFVVNNIYGGRGSVVFATCVSRVFTQFYRF